MSILFTYGDGVCWTPGGASGYAYGYYKTMKRRRNYPTYLKVLANLHDRVWPEYSERVFIKTMGQWFFWRYNFKHQGLVGPWRPDFVSYKHRLIIEIDGAGKVPKDIVLQQQYYDAQEHRDADLYRRGFSVLHWRFVDVRDHPHEVKRKTKQWARNPARYTRFDR